METGTIHAHDAWRKPIHAECFDVWADLPLRALAKTYESFNEVRLFKTYRSSIEGRTFLEIGCATGELYRYMRAYFPGFEYYGFDISGPAVERAKAKYPKGNFFVCDEDLSNLRDHAPSPAVLFARDVVLHQPQPFEFLIRLLSLPAEAAVLRIRSRDKGESVLDPERSCQWHYGRWVPYMVLNIDEVIGVIKDNAAFEFIHVLRSYRQLGGRHNRFLPKECYYPETGTAETAIFVKLARERISDPEIRIESMPDAHPRLTVFERGTAFLKRRFKAARRRRAREARPQPSLRSG